MESENNQLIMQTAPVNFVNWFDFEKFVRHYFNEPKYSVFLTNERITPDSKLFLVVKNELRSRLINLNKFKDNPPTVKAILTKMCYDGAIPEGNYLLEISDNE